MFLQALLRAVNIPVRYVVYEQHAMPYVATEGKALSHGDGPYSCAWSPSTPRLDVSTILLDQATFDAWFSPSLSSAARLNVGRRTVELGVQNLSDSFLVNRCADIAAKSTNHAASKVYAEAVNVYSVADLEGMGFWDKLDATIAQRGGCAEIHLT